MANSDSYATAEDTPLTPGGSGRAWNDTDPEMNPLAAVLVAGPSHGTLALNADGSFGYAPAANFHGTDGFTYKANDGSLTSAVTTVTIAVNPVNDAPTVSSPDRNSHEGEVIDVTIAGSDVDSNPLTFTAANLPPGLAMALNGTVAGTIGFETVSSYLVTVTANDGAAQTSATFTWTVTNTNRPPTANPDAASVIQGQSATIAVRANDTDPDVATTLTIVSVTAPTSGTAVINPLAGTITYTASPTFTGGTATFSYTISDGSLSATALVTVTVLMSNAPPVCSAATGGEIFPPNHKFYLARILGVFDPDGHAVTITVTGIWQDELIDSTGDGKFAPDGRIENGQAWVRAERNGHGNKAAGNGRVYEILFTAADAEGGSCTGSVFYTVPHDKGQRSTAIDSGVRYDSTGVIPGVRNKTQIHTKSPLP